MFPHDFLTPSSEQSKILSNLASGALERGEDSNPVLPQHLELWPWRVAWTAGCTFVAWAQDWRPVLHCPAIVSARRLRYRFLRKAIQVLTLGLWIIPFTCYRTCFLLAWKISKDGHKDMHDTLPQAESKRILRHWRMAAAVHFVFRKTPSNPWQSRLDGRSAFAGLSTHGLQGGVRKSPRILWAWERS